MKITDSHVHIDINNKFSIVEYLQSDLIDGFNLILNSDEEKDLFFDLRKEIENSNKIIKLTTTLDYRKNNNDFLNKLSQNGYTNFGLKLHPRFEKYTADDIDGIINFVKQFHFNYIIVDAFYYGHELQYNISKELILRLAIEFPQINIIAAHSGGYKVLEFMLTMRTLKNIYFDISFMNYLKLSSIINDFRQLIAYNSDRVLFGTDFPYFKIFDSLDLFMKITDDFNDKNEIREHILNTNFKRIFLI